LLRRFGKVVGNDVLYNDIRQRFGIPLSCSMKGLPRIILHSRASIHIGENVVLNSNPEGYHALMASPATLIADEPESKIIIGHHSRLHGCCIHAKRSIRVGSYCLLASGAQLLDTNGHTSDLRLSKHRHYIRDLPEEIVIGDYTWVGLNAIILKGVAIGCGSIIAANSLVLKGNYPAYSLIGGNPAKVLRSIDKSEVLSSSDDPQKHSWFNEVFYKY